MELIVINENKLKITMDKADMKLYGLDENDFHCSVINTREILEKILHNYPYQTGFENISRDDKILIQLYPEKNGGCELFVTKISLDEKEEPLFMHSENEERYLLPKPIPKNQIAKNTLLIYRFEKLEYAIGAAKEMCNRQYCGGSSFYRDFEGKYFLFVNNSKTEINNNTCDTNFLSEFGELMNTENSRMLLLERGNCIFKEKAIEQLLQL